MPFNGVLLKIALLRSPELSLHFFLQRKILFSAFLFNECPILSNLFRVIGLKFTSITHFVALYIKICYEVVGSHSKTDFIMYFVTFRGRYQDKHNI